MVLWNEIIFPLAQLFFKSLHGTEINNETKIMEIHWHEILGRHKSIQIVVKTEYT